MERWLASASLPTGNGESIMESCAPFATMLAKELAVEDKETNKRTAVCCDVIR